MLGLSLGAGCAEDELGTAVAKAELVPQPTAAQQAVEAPPGIALGRVPLYSPQQALFRLSNPSSGLLLVQAPHVAETVAVAASVGLFQSEPDDLAGAEPVTTWPLPVGPNQAVTLRVVVEPLGDGAASFLRVNIPTNAGVQRATELQAHVTGEGLFVGTPAIELSYGLGPLPGLREGGGGDAIPEAAGGQDDAPGNAPTAGPLPAGCIDEETDTPPDAGAPCVLPTLDFGLVARGAPATREVRLADVPRSGTCSQADGVLERQRDPNTCQPVCVLTVTPDVAGNNVGLGVAPDNAGFSLAGRIPTPLQLTSARDPCVPSVTSGMVQSPVPLFVSFDHEGPPGTYEATLHVESNAANAPRLALPLRVETREAPVAVATIARCGDPGVALSRCVPQQALLEPLDTIFFDGLQSADPNGEALVSYAWEWLQWPADAMERGLGWDDPASAQPSAVVPLPGTYAARLTVTNTSGLQSLPSTTSDVSFRVVPQSRLHVQLLWGHPNNDLDLHVVSVAHGNKVYSEKNDCFWLNCRPRMCAEGAGAEGPGADPQAAENHRCDPVRWDEGTAAFQGSNPRLDLDDTSGNGPENFNLDAPAAGRYRVFAHYYGLVSDLNVPTIAIVRIFADGLLAAEYRRELKQHDLWAVAEVGWQGRSDQGPAQNGAGDGDSSGEPDTLGGATLREAQSDAPGQVGAVFTLDEMPYPQGVYLGPIF